MVIKGFDCHADKDAALDVLERGRMASHKKLSEPLDNKIAALEFERQNTLDSLAQVGAQIRGISK